MGLGLSEILLILVIAVLVIKPDKLQDYSKAAGSAFREFNKAKREVNDIVQDVADSLDINDGGDAK